MTRYDNRRPDPGEVNTMLQITREVPFAGRYMHIRQRRLFPSLQTFHDFTYNSWKNFKRFLETSFEIDESTSFQWLQSENEADGKFYECIYLKQGFTFFYSGFSESAEFIFDFEGEPEIRNEICIKLKEFRGPESRDQIGLLTSVHGSLIVKFFKYRQYEHDVLPYLGKEIRSFFQSVIRQIGQGQQNGLYLLYGEPGTGKTSFIKRVLSEVNRQAVFVTPQMAGQLDSPELLSLLTDYSGSVLVIEDAEKILMKREGDDSNAVSTILNLSDGFTADFLNLTIFCTFNTKITDIDPALLRKGRLTGMQEFSKLSPENADKMAKKLGIQTKTETPITLAELCNVDQPKYSKSKNGIGFKVE